jgi:mannose-6-phosphate isomerase-like protein (cupin superfamily)
LNKRRPYRTNVTQVPLATGLTAEEGWVQMQVRFLVDQHTAGADRLVLGWTVLPPGARHERHRHVHADEFFIVLKGQGAVYTDEGEEPAGEGDVVYSPRLTWHGFHNTSQEEVVLVWGWVGAGSLEAAGYELPERGS